MPIEQSVGRGGGRGQRHERVVRVPVLARQVGAGRVGRLAAGGDVRVLGEEERLEAALLDQAAERRGSTVSSVTKYPMAKFMHGEPYGRVTSRPPAKNSGWLQIRWAW